MKSSSTLKRFGAAGFAFFAIKGCVWLGIAAAVSLEIMK